MSENEQSKYSILETISSPVDFRDLSMDDLLELSSQVRHYIIETIAEKGGHLGSALGVVELTVALHYVFNTPQDKLLWDVGHQCHAHKILTGRFSQFPTIKQYGGLSGYPSPEESEYDLYKIGHSSTSISQALGHAIEKTLNQREDEKVVAVIGDGALTAGMAYEALNHVGSLKSDLLVILNDNEMSISKNVGAISNYLNRIVSDPKYCHFRESVSQKIESWCGNHSRKIKNFIKKTEGTVKGMFLPRNIFEELGFYYVGPIDGHDLVGLVEILGRLNQVKGPVLFHVVTEKGRGLSYADQDPCRLHASGPFQPLTGQGLSSQKTVSFTDVFEKSIVQLKEEDTSIVAITAAMTVGVGLSSFSQKYPESFFDVGIAEQHAMTLSGAFSCSGLKPVLTMYATFLQRAHDQLIHDVYLQKLPVLITVDRWGIVGPDGASHAGVFALSQILSLPGGTLFLPKSGWELEEFLKLALEQMKGPTIVGYPKESAFLEKLKLISCRPIEWGKADVMREGTDAVIFSSSVFAWEALQVADQFFQQFQKEVAVIDLRFIRPLDEETILKWSQRVPLIFTIEETMLRGGVGSSVLEILSDHGIHKKVIRLGVEDRFVQHGSRRQILDDLGLTADKIFHKLCGHL